MSKENENNDPTFEGLNPPTLFREFAAECMELAQTIPTPEKRSLYMKMASLWHQMAQRWERGVLPKSKRHCRVVRNATSQCEQLSMRPSTVFHVRSL
jgi:hypothetical protein